MRFAEPLRLYCEKNSQKECGAEHFGLNAASSPPLCGVRELAGSQAASVDSGFIPSQAGNADGRLIQNCAVTEIFHSL
jgi:hypothetical protein